MKKRLIQAKERRRQGLLCLSMRYKRLADLYEFSIGRRISDGSISPAVLMLKMALSPSARDVGARGPFVHPNVMWDKTDTALVIYWPRKAGAVTVAAYYPLKAEDYGEDLISVTRNDRLNISIDNGMGAIGSLHYLCSSFRLDPEDKGRAKKLLPSLFFCLNRFAIQLDLFPDHYVKTAFKRR
jgi:hypothetical protein